MISNTIKSYRIPFIPRQNYIVRGYSYKYMNLTKPGTYVKGDINYNICIKFESSSIKNGLKNVKKVKITN